MAIVEQCFRDVLPPSDLGRLWHERASTVTVPLGEQPELVIKGTFLEFDFASRSNRRRRVNSDIGLCHSMVKEANEISDKQISDDETISTASGTDEPSPSWSCASEPADSLDMDTLELHSERADVPSVQTWFHVPVFVPVTFQPPGNNFAAVLDARKSVLGDTVAQLAAAALQAQSTAHVTKVNNTTRKSAKVGKGAGAKKPATKTTLMLRNVPLQYTRSMLLDLLNTEGYRGKYDFVYLPINFDTQLAFGYAFVNFVDGAVAESARQHFQGFNDWMVPCKEQCETSWSDPYQGLSSNVERYRNSPVMHESIPEEHKPILLVAGNGKSKAFPAPTRLIKPPRGVRRSTPIEVAARLSS